MLMGSLSNAEVKEDNGNTQVPLDKTGETPHTSLLLLLNLSTGPNGLQAH